MKEKKEKRIALHTSTILAMKAGGKDLSDIEENEGLRVSCGKTGIKSFFIVIKAL